MYKLVYYLSRKQLTARHQPRTLPPPPAPCAGEVKGGARQHLPMYLPLPRAAVEALRDIPGGDDARINYLLGPLGAKLVGRTGLQPDVLKLVRAISRGRRDGEDVGGELREGEEEEDGSGGQGDDPMQQQQVYGSSNYAAPVGLPPGLAPEQPQQQQQQEAAERGGAAAQPQGPIAEAAVDGAAGAGSAGGGVLGQAGVGGAADLNGGAQAQPGSGAEAGALSTHLQLTKADQRLPAQALLMPVDPSTL